MGPLPRLLAALLWLGALTPRTARAEGPAKARDANAAHEETLAQFRLGVARFQQGAFGEARDAFLRAYESSGDARLLFNLGQTELELHDYARARRAFEKYITLGGEDVPSARREDLAETLAALAERTAGLLLDAPHAEQVTVDGEPVQLEAGPTWLNAGEHELEASFPGGERVREFVVFRGGELRRVKLSPRPAPVVVARPNEAVPTRLSPRRRGAIALFGAAGALGASALVSGLSARRATSVLNDELSQTPADRPRIAALRAQANLLAVTSDVLTGLSVAAAASSVVLWLRGAPATRHDDAPLAVSVGPGSVRVRGRF